MRDILATILISLGTGLAGHFSGWFFGRKRQSIENIDMAIATWQKVVDSLENRVDKLLDEVNDLTKQNRLLRDEIESLKDEIRISKSKNRKITTLENKIATYEKLLDDNGIDY